MGMNYEQFIKEHIGKGMDYDSCAGVQCVDLVKFYLHEVFGLDPKNWGDAHDYYDNWRLYTDDLYENFNRLPNTPEFVPKKGDIVVWSSKLSAGGWGHIAIATGEGDTNHFYTYDQNWTGRHDPCAKIRHDYRCVLGVLRAKDQSKITGAKVLDKSGYKLGDKTIGVLAFKQLLLIARDKKLIKTKVKNDRGFGKGTQKAVNELLGKWGYEKNGVAGIGFIKRLGKTIK